MCCIFSHWEIIQIEITFEIPSYPYRVTTFRKTNSKCYRRTEESGTLAYCWQEYKIVGPFIEINIKVPQSLKIELPSDPAIAFLGIFPEDTIPHHRETCLATFPVLFPIKGNGTSQITHIWMNGWIKKTWCI